MKPDWDKLMGAFKDSPSILVGDADCTAGGKSLCESVGVRGYPTIKHGDPSDLQDYKGGRDYAALKKFADGLGPSCSPANLDFCDDEKKKQIEEYKALDAATRDEMIKNKEKEIESLETGFKTFVEGLQKQYEDASAKKEKEIEDIKNSGFGILKSVHAHEKKAKSEL